MGEKQSLLRNYALKRKKGFKGTQKQEVAQKRRKGTRAVEVTFVREDDVVSEQILGSGGCPGVPVHGGIPIVFISIHGVVTQFVNVSFLCVPVHEDTTKFCPSQNLLSKRKIQPNDDESSSNERIEDHLAPAESIQTCFNGQSS